ncbi:MAG: prephenate dehydrogenase [Bacteroidota bacterium]|nr:prephenate dehydrogenase [Bacteroidota bacterium]|tara:strand:- start:289 stop:1137 length:849 start_codon:yes stop_codon:yes gene_type:complete
MKIGIIGLGLIGSSLALKIDEIYNDIYIYGEDICKSNLNYAIENNIINNKLEEKDYSKLDILFLAIPVDGILDVLSTILDKVGQNTLVVDLGSTKMPICDLVNNNQNRSKFLAAHPIAGTEFSGPMSAESSLFNNKTIILCETEKTENKLLNIAKELFLSIGMNIKEMKADEHDKHIAYVSHLSHITSFMLGKTVMDKEKDEETIYDMAGSGFESTVRLGKSSPSMWTPIFHQNKKNIVDALDEYLKNIKNFKHLIETDNLSEMFNEMKEINGIKNILKGIK